MGAVVVCVSPEMVVLEFAIKSDDMEYIRLYSTPSSGSGSVVASQLNVTCSDGWRVSLSGEERLKAFGGSLEALTRKCQVDGISFIPAQPVETLPNVMEGAFLKKLRRFFLYLYKEKKGGDSFIDNSREYLLYSLGRLDGRVPHPRCFAPYTDLHIDCCGNVFPCVSLLGLNRPWLNLNGRNLKEVWFSSEMQRLRRLREKCAACEYLCHLELGFALNKASGIIKPGFFIRKIRPTGRYTSFRC